MESSAAFDDRFKSELYHYKRPSKFESFKLGSIRLTILPLPKPSVLCYKLRLRIYF